MFTAIEGGRCDAGRPSDFDDRSNVDGRVYAPLRIRSERSVPLALLSGETRGVRSIGSAALNLCFLAAGSADAVWEFDTYPWDVAAGVVIAREAGAIGYRPRGSPTRTATGTTRSRHTRRGTNSSDRTDRSTRICPSSRRRTGTASSETDQRRLTYRVTVYLTALLPSFRFGFNT